MKEKGRIGIDLVLADADGYHTKEEKIFRQTDIREKNLVLFFFTRRIININFGMKKGRPFSHYVGCNF